MQKGKECMFLMCFFSPFQNVVAHLEQHPIVREFLKPPVPLRKSFDASNKSPEPPKSPDPKPVSSEAKPPSFAPTKPAPSSSPPPPVAAPQLVLRDSSVLRDSLDLGEEDFLGGSDDELLNRNETLDDIVD